MSKDLEALERLKWGYAITREERINLCECIENELKHHEHNMSTIIPNLVKTTKEQARVIEEQKKELKVLEIIKNKKVDILPLLNEVSLIGYNVFAREDKRGTLTQEEYDLLKEVLL